MTYALTTRRLGLRPYTAADIDALREVFADPGAARFYPAMHEQAALERWITWNLANYELHGFGLWALELLDSGRFIGDAGITYQTVEGQRVLEIGYHLHPSLRAQGFATEAAQGCLSHAFTALNAEFVCSIVDPRNTASIKVAGRLHAAQREFAGKHGRMLLFHTSALQFAAQGR